MHYLQAGPLPTPSCARDLKRLLLYPLEPELGLLRSAGIEEDKKEGEVRGLGPPKQRPGSWAYCEGSRGHEEG